MKSFKKSILTVCNKLISTAAPEVNKDLVLPSLPIKTTNLVLKSKLHPRSSTIRRRHSSRQRRSLRPKSTSHANLISVDTRSTNASPSSLSLVSSSTSSHSYDAVVTSSSSSSGYGTSSTSTATATMAAVSAAPTHPLAVFFNLDNYFYDDNFIKYACRAQESALEQRRAVVKCLLDYEADYLSRMRRAIECGVRPLSFLADQATFFTVFQNIEKICSITEFIKTSIDDSMLLTMDIYKSTLTIIHEYISIITSSYELYVRGFTKAVELIQKAAFKSQLNKLKSTQQVSFDFDLNQLIRMPIDNLAKLFCAFDSLLDMTPIVDQDDYDKLSTICTHLKDLVDYLDVDLKSVDASSSSSAENYDQIRDVTVIKHELPAPKSLDKRLVNRRRSIATTGLPNDYTDYDGYKVYFV